MTPKVSKEMRDLLSEIADRNEASRAARKQTAAPEVGIFFAFGGHLWVNGTPLKDAVAYGDFRIHDEGHEQFWAKLQKANSVPSDLDYDVAPRGRVAYSTKTLSFQILADKCLLKDKRMLSRIFQVMHLPTSPTQTTVGPDSHYKCPGCMPPPKD